MCYDNAEKVFKTCDNLAETKNDKFSRRIGEKCLETTIRAKEDYTNNLYDWNTSKKELQMVDDLLNNALTYYGVGCWDGLRIAYISDLHLHHHLKYYDDSEKRLINIMMCVGQIVKKVFILSY